MNLPPRRDAVRQFWVAIRAGASTEDSVAGLGNSRKTGPRYIRQTGGVVPAYVTAQSSGRYLSFAEREEIHGGVERGDSIRLIARRLGRAPSTVFHELRRNMRQRYRRRHRQGRPVTEPWSYRPSYAQRRAELMARRPKRAKNGDASGAAPARAGQTEREPEPSTDLSRAPSAVLREPGDVGVTRDHLPVDLRSGSGRSPP